MYRHSPIRNPRSKGMKIKHVVQVLLLIGVCIWLIFQVKRSYDKRKEFDASDNKVVLNTRTHISDDVTKFGRKYLHPKVEEIEIHQETQEQEEDEGNDDKKHEDEEQDDNKIDEEIDENEQERSDMEIDREEVNIIDEEDKDEKEVNDNEEKDGQNQTDNEVSLADHNDDEDGSAVHTNEAREENYNGDDASSAVTHNGPTKNEIKNGTLIEYVGQTAKNTTSSDTIQEKDYESIVTSLNATTASIDNGPPSSTLVEIDSTEPSNVTVSAGNSSSTTYGRQVVSNATIDEITQGSSNSTEDNTLDALVESDGGEHLETNDVTDQVTEESLDPDEVEHDPSHLDDDDDDEKEVRTDLDTLPEIETEGGDSEDSAAE